MELPQLLLDSLEGTCGYNRACFLRRHEENESLSSIRLNPSKKADIPYEKTPVPWCRSGFYLKDRPSFTFDPLFHAGAYYVQEASSMLLEQAFLQLTDREKAICALDLCAAPGGKATHLQSLLPQGSFLVANEVIRSRNLILRDNLVRWGTTEAVVTQNDPEHFRKLPDFFDWITVDAPCSGSGLFRKDPEAISQWSPSNVKLCAERQQRILAAAWEALKPGGILFYATCSYSYQEDEEVVQWMVKTQGAIVRTLELDPSWGVTASTEGYRCWPDQMKGEGFYFCCLQKPAADTPADRKNRSGSLVFLSEKEKSKLIPWATVNDYAVFSLEKTWFAFPQKMTALLQLIREQLYVVYAGVRLGEWMRDKLVPDHALAMSPLLSSTVVRSELTKEDAICFLQRRELAVSWDEKGWRVLCYKGLPLGWVNVIPGRINNYYPKELRILKDH